MAKRSSPNIEGRQLAKKAPPKSKADRALASLEARRVEILQSIQSLDLQMERVGEIGDTAAIQSGADVNAGLLEFFAEQLRVCEERISAVRDGVRAAVCEACGGRIPAPRLDAIPGVKTCVRCQSLRESAAGVEEPANGPEHWEKISGIPDAETEEEVDVDELDARERHGITADQ